MGALRCVSNVRVCRTIQVNRFVFPSRLVYVALRLLWVGMGVLWCEFCPLWFPMGLLWVETWLLWAGFASRKEPIRQPESCNMF